MKKVVVVGAGISGLALAYFLEKKYGNQVQVTLLEKENRVGGWIQTFSNEEVLFELGPRGFRSHGKGALTVNLAQELGLTLIHANPHAKKRYIACAGKLKEVNFRYLATECGLWPLLCEPWKKKRSQNDETIASFFRRRLNQRYVDNLIYPLCQGIYAEDPEELSIKACFPTLWEAEQRHGSLVKAFFKRKKETAPPLTSFIGGMQALPSALEKAIKGPILCNTKVEKITPHTQGVCVEWKEGSMECDHLFIATPSVFGLHSFSQKKVSLTTVNCAFFRENLKYKGFGFLTRRKEELPLLGVTFDSEIFVEHNRMGELRLCVMLLGEHDEKQALKKAEEALTKYLGIERRPDLYLVSVAKEAIYGYSLGHCEGVARLEKSLPEKITLMGSRFYGVAVNDCIAKAHSICYTHAL